MGDRYYGGLPGKGKTKQDATGKALAAGLEQAARAMGGAGRKSEITINVAWAIKKGDVKKVKDLLYKHGSGIIGGQGSVNEIQQWIDGQLPEGVGMRGLLQRLEEAADAGGDLGALYKALFTAAVQGLLAHADKGVGEKAVYDSVVAKTTQAAERLGWRFVGGNDEPGFESEQDMQGTIDRVGRVFDYVKHLVLRQGDLENVAIAVGKVKGTAPYATVSMLGMPSLGALSLGFKRKA